MIMFNARSIRNKWLEFRGFIATESADLIAITETWINTSNRDFEAEYELPGYQMFRKDRQDRMGGGVLVYCRNHLQSTINTINSPHELIAVDIQGLGRKVQIIVVYRPPHQTMDIDIDMYNVLTRLVGNKVTVLTGDFNCQVDWESLTAAGEGTRLLDFSNDNYLVQAVREPTRGNNILDLIFSSDDDLVKEVTVGECLGRSDHNIVFCRIMLPTQPLRQTRELKLNLRQANYPRLREQLENLPLVREGPIEEMWNTFKTGFNDIQSNCIPLKRVADRNMKRNPKWFTGEIKRAIIDRKRAYNLVKTHSTPARVGVLTELRRKVKRLVRVAKRDEEYRVADACQSNPKEFFAYVNSRKPIRSTIGPLVTDQGSLISSDLEIAEELNRFFTSVFTNEDTSISPIPPLRYNGNSPLSSIVCTRDEVLAKLGRLNPKKSSGADGFLPGVVKNVSNQIVPHLVPLFNRSLDLGMVPDDMKIANVTPIYKKGPKDIAGNYRPISLTSIVGKMLESIIVDRIVDFLETNELLGDSQHGFRRKRSCLTNLIDFFHHMLSIYDTSRAIDVLYLDFRKAFDKVPHKRLMSKVRAIGVRGKVADWIEHWLSDRRQRVVINGVSSDWTPIVSGVPQGSVLGPLLFIIYINDIDCGLISKISKFADDTKLGTDAADPLKTAQLQQDLDNIGQWSNTWQMPFNTGKCKVMHIGFANTNVSYNLLGTELEVTNLERDLGVYISKDLKFSYQCIEVEKRAQKLLGYINRNFKYRDKRVILSLYNALVRPLLEYAVQFWSPSLVKDIERLERVQARATKLIPAIRNKGYQRRLEDLNLFTLEKRRLRGQLIETFKTIRGFNNVDSSSVFTLADNNLRNHGWKLQLQRYRTRPYGDFMTNKIGNLWNRLPQNVVASDSVDMFKRRIDRILHDLNF